MNVIKHQGLYNIKFQTETDSISARFGEGQFQPLTPSQTLTTYPPLTGLAALSFRVSTNFPNSSPVLVLNANIINDQERHDIKVVCHQTPYGYAGFGPLHFYGVPTNNRCPSLKIHFNEVSTGDFTFKAGVDYQISVIVELEMQIAL